MTTIAIRGIGFAPTKTADLVEPPEDDEQDDPRAAHEGGQP